jgi:hypothetical protein
VGGAIIFAPTDTQGFHEHVFSGACAIYFPKGLVEFHGEDGSWPEEPPRSAELPHYPYQGKHGGSDGFRTSGFLMMPA